MVVGAGGGGGGEQEHVHMYVVHDYERTAYQNRVMVRLWARGGGGG